MDRYYFILEVQFYFFDRLFLIAQFIQVSHLFLVLFLSATKRHTLSPLSLHEALTKHNFLQNTGIYAMCFKALSTSRMRILSFAGEAWFLSL